MLILRRIFLPLMVLALPAFTLADMSDSAKLITESAKLVAEDAFTLDPGRTEVEFRYQYLSADTLFDNDGKRTPRGDLQGQILIAKATRGLREGLDASMEVAWRDLIKDEDGDLGDGIGNLTVNAKWLFHQNPDKGLGVSWITGFTAPFAGDAVTERLAPGQDYWSINNLLVLTYVTGGFSLNLDAGHYLAFGNERAEQRNEFIADIGLGYQLSSRLQLEAEFNYGHATVSRGNGSFNYAATVGALFLVSDTMLIQAGVQEILDGQNADEATVWMVNFAKSF